MFLCSLKSDSVEVTFTKWAKKALHKINNNSKVWNVTCQFDSKKLKTYPFLQLIALYGHGCPMNGAFINSNNKTILSKRDAGLFHKKLIFAWYCYSMKLCNALPTDKKPKAYLGFNEDYWIILDPSNNPNIGFEESSWKALEILLKKQNAELSCKGFRDEATEWATRWLCYLIYCNINNEDSWTIWNGVECILAFLHNSNIIDYYDSSAIKQDI